jgi:hypothetical protein
LINPLPIPPVFFFSSFMSLYWYRLCLPLLYFQFSIEWIVLANSVLWLLVYVRSAAAFTKFSFNYILRNFLSSSNFTYSVVNPVIYTKFNFLRNNKTISLRVPWTNSTIIKLRLNFVGFSRNDS